LGRKRRHIHVLVDCDAANFLEGNVFWVPLLRQVKDVVCSKDMRNSEVNPHPKQVLTFEFLSLRCVHGLEVDGPAWEITSLNGVPHVSNTEIGVFTGKFD